MTRPTGEPADDPAADAQRATVKGDHVTAVLLHQEAARLSDESYRRAVDGNDPRATAEAARQSADHWGRLGGALRRAGQHDEALEAYRRGAQLETDHRLDDTYNRTNVIMLEVLLHPERLERMTPEIDAVTAIVQHQVEGTRRTQSWAWADLGLLKLLGGHNSAADLAYRNYARTAPKRAYVNSTVTVLRQVREAVAPLHDVSGFDDAIGMLETLTRP